MGAACNNSETIASGLKLEDCCVCAVHKLRRLLTVVLKPSLIRRLPFLLRQTQSLVHRVPIRRVASFVEFLGEIDFEINEGSLKRQESGKRGIKQGPVPVE